MKTKDLFHRLPPTAAVLVIRLRSMGDCLLLTSPIRALKEEFPGFRISVLVESRFAACFDDNPDIDHTIALDDKLAAKTLIGRRFDLILNLHGGPTSLVFSMLASGKRVGAEHYRFPRLYHGLVPPPERDKHSVETTMAAFRWMGVRRMEPPPLRYAVHTSARARAGLLVEESPYAVIHPGALMATKRWSPDRYAALGRWLAARGLTVVVTCGPGEESEARAVAAGVGSAKLSTGLTIPELAELLRGARLYVGNDSGPMHLAAAVGTPTLALWGSSDSRRWRPWHTRHRVVQNPFECNPCPGYRCLVAASPLCIESVSVEQAIAAASELLKDENNTDTQSG